MAASRCEAELERARGSWSAARRDATVMHLDDLALDEELLDRALPHYDDWIERWRTVARPHCETPAEPAAAACLERQLAQFDASVTLVLEQSGFRLGGAISAAALRLPDPERCADRDWLAHAPEPAPAELEAKARILATDLATVEAAIALEQWVGLGESAQRVVDSAEALGHAPLLAEAQLALAEYERLGGTVDDAIGPYEAALATSDRGVHDRVRVEAALGLAQVFVELGRPADAQRWLREVEKFAAEVRDAELRSRHALVDARLSARLGEFVAADERLAEETTIDPLLAIDLRLERSEVAQALGDLEDAEQHAEIAERKALSLVGPNATPTRAAKQRHAQVRLAAGDLETAGRLAEEAADATMIGRSSRHDRAKGFARALVGDVALANDDLAAAREHYADTEVCFYADAYEAWPLAWQGALELRAGDSRLARQRFDAAAAKLDEYWEPGDPRRLALLEVIAEAQLDAGDLSGAEATLDEAFAIADAAFGWGPARAFVEMQRARLSLARGDQRAALAQLDDSHVAFSGGLGQYHPAVTDAVLQRADLAWALGKRDYAARLYGSVGRRLEELRGADDPAVIRAAERAAD